VRLTFLPRFPPFFFVFFLRRLSFCAQMPGTFSRSFANEWSVTTVRLSFLFWRPPDYFSLQDGQGSGWGLFFFLFFPEGGISGSGHFFLFLFLPRFPPPFCEDAVKIGVVFFLLGPMFYPFFFLERPFLPTSPKGLVAATPPLPPPKCSTPWPSLP